MIKNDFRYIIKRIIIGIGICFGLSLLNGCSSVLAYDSSYYKTTTCTNYNHAPVVGDTYTYEINDFIYKIEYKNNGIYVNNDLYESSSDYLQRYIVVGSTSSSNAIIYILKFNSPERNLNTSYNSNYPFFNDYPQNVLVLSQSNFINGKRYVFENGSYSSQSNISNVLNLFTNSSFNVYGSTQQLKYYIGSNQPASDCILSKKDSERDNVPVNNSTIADLGIRKNIDEEQNLIVSYTFSPTFNNFDTSKFTYQYKIGSNNWLTITSNDVSFNVNQNTTVYFRVLKNSDNSVVDSRSITLNNILKYDDNINDDYNIKYTSENRNVNDDESVIQHYVDTVVINFEYFPKYSNFKYQYQYVNDGDSLSTWENMPNNDYERSYSVDTNGIMYNRILDENDNVLYTSTFQVNSIGTLMLNDNINWYNKLFGRINYGKGIYSIFFLPLRILEVLENTFTSTLENGICTSSYSFGSLFGHELIMPCINIRSLIGNTIYNFIDIIGVGVICLAIINFIVNIYNGIVFMNLEDYKDNEKDRGGRLL